MPFVRSTAPFSEPQNTSSSTSENQSPKDRPKKEIDFPLSDPKYSLDDMIITDEVKEELSTIIEAEKCWKRVFEDWGLADVMGDRRNLFVNLYGYPGTGKTMAAHAIAKAIGKKMICVNYAEIESKYVGETSKNLTRLFKTAAEKNAVIFFDEADAFLSKRVTNMNNSTDVSVNQTRSVLLTLLNDFNGVIIFATNLCFHSETVECSHCGERIWADDNAGTDSTPLCNSCYDDYYTTCECCGRIIHRDYANYDDDDDYAYCDRCYEERQNSSIHEYNYKPDPIFYGDSKRYFGVELEIDEGGKNGDNADTLLGIGTEPELITYLKERQLYINTPITSEEDE